MILAFAIFDGFPVSPGHVLVTTRRIVETWFDATDEEQSALMALVKEAKRLLDLQLSPKPDGYNVGFNSGAASGQTVPHVHIHVIPRYLGDMADPRGGVRHVIPDKGNYLRPALPSGSPEPPISASQHFSVSAFSPSLTLATGHPTRRSGKASASAFPPPRKSISSPPSSSPPASISSSNRSSPPSAPRPASASSSAITSTSLPPRPSAA
jgi:diadenosine tetraphosphate (Ap4A) HIT family hydrolase